MMMNSSEGWAADGFPGQRMRVVPRPVVEAALTRPATEALLVTDCGYFPNADHHRKSRRHGLAVAVVIVCVGGTGHVDFDDAEHGVRAGEVLVIPPGTAHTYHADEDDPWTIWWMHVAGVSVDELLTAAGVTRQAPVMAVADAHRLAALVEEVVTRIERDETERTLVAASGAAWHLLASLSAEQVPAGSRTDPVRQAQNYLRARIGTRTSLAELSALVGLSSSHFSALFRAKTGTGVVEYQTRLRMGVARELLDTTTRTIESTARAVGYPDPFYFSRQFRLIHGVSPSDYRARTRNDVHLPPRDDDDA